MMINEEILDLRIRNNAMISYFLIFLCASFLFVKHNPYVDHPFVRSHTKTALFLHTLMLLVITLFLWFHLFEWISWNDYHLNFILASTLLTWILGLILKGMYLAHHGKEFIISEVIHFVKTEKILDTNHDSNLDEKDKATIIFSLIPFLWIIIYGKHSDHTLIKNLAHLNLIITLAISFIYITGYSSAANLLLLVWIIGIVFFSIQVIIKGELMSIDLSRIPTFGELYEMFICGGIYMKTYLSWKDFKNWEDIRIERNEQARKQTKEGRIEGSKEKEMKLPEWLVYIPIINFVTLFNIHSQKKIHIINGFWISLVFIFSLLVVLYDWNYLFFFLFPVMYGFAFIESDPVYKLPFFYDVGNNFLSIANKIRLLLWKTRKMKQTENKVSLKVGEKSE